MTQATGHIWNGLHLPPAMDVLGPEAAAAIGGGAKTLLIGWELGGGRGHIERLVPLVDAYLERGWRVVAALRDRTLGAARFGELVARHGAAMLSIVQAPHAPDRRFPNLPLFSLPQIFCCMGYDEPALVGALVRQWEGLLQHVRPDIVLSDYAPTLNLAARGRIAIMVIGNGWTIAPECDAMPMLLPAPGEGEKADHDTRVVACAEAVMGSVRAPQRFCDLLRGDVNAVCVIPELDPYRASRTERYCWSPELPTPAPVDPAARHGGLVYLPADHPDLPAVTKACAGSNMAFRAYFGGAGAGQSGNLTVCAEPIDFIAEIPRSRLVIHHGGLGTAMWAMVNGVAQWACARDLEKMLVREAF